MSGLLRGLFASLMMALIVVGVVVVLLFFDYRRFLETPITTPQSAKTFTVKPGESLTAVIRRFPDSGLELAKQSFFPSGISQWLGTQYFRYLGKTSHQAHQIKTGEYLLKPRMTPPELLDLMVSGKVVEYKIRFIEGWTFERMRKALSEDKSLKKITTEMSDTELMQALNLTDTANLEGWFFPSTYQFHSEATDMDILSQSHRIMKRNINKAWQERNKNIRLKTPYELLILASIIEKETSLDSERNKISGVFHRRMKKGMRLQTDPTVIYGLGDKYKGTIYKKDLRTDTPYNTYTRKGLPPTPIAMPSLSSLMAAGQPDKGKSLYFVADGSGGHAFSRTYKQHLKAVKKYRTFLKKRAEKKAAEAEATADNVEKDKAKTAEKTKEKS